MSAPAVDPAVAPRLRDRIGLDGTVEPMAFHHVAFATNDLVATHVFYTEVMGFELVKVVNAPTPSGQGWARHVFYETGDGQIAFWELHDPTIGPFDAAISTNQGLPEWVNHLAFRAELDELDARRDRWLEHGIDVAEIDHEFCRSVYAMDPNGILVEFCADVRPLDERDRAHAAATIFVDDPPMDPVKEPVFHVARKPAVSSG